MAKIWPVKYKPHLPSVDVAAVRPKVLILLLLLLHYKIHHECKDGIEKFVLRISYWHYNLNKRQVSSRKSKVVHDSNILRSHCVFKIIIYT